MSAVIYTNIGVLKNILEDQSLGICVDHSIVWSKFMVDCIFPILQPVSASMLVWESTEKAKISFGSY